MIGEVRDAKDPRFGRLLALFHDEFPPETREPDEELIAEVEGRSPVPYRYFVWEDPEVRGFVRFACLARTKALFVVHVAVAPSARAQGIGSRLLEAVRRTEPELPVVCEVDPEEAMEWWTRRGARTITPTYTQPALRPETGPVPFHLMALGNVADAASLIETFYGEVWALSPDHPFVRRAVEGARQQAALRPVTGDEVARTKGLEPPTLSSED